jgi:hypothetical protein
LLLNPLEEIRKMRTRSLSRTFQEGRLFDKEMTVESKAATLFNGEIHDFVMQEFFLFAFTKLLQLNTFPNNQTLFREFLH